MKPLTLEDIAARIERLERTLATIASEIATLGAQSVRLLRPDEVADLFGYGRSEIYEMMKNGTIISVTIEEDRSKRIPLVALQGLIRRRIAEAGDFDADKLYNLLYGEKKEEGVSA